MNADNFAWENGFPSVYAHTSISFLKRCPGFSDAKGGDMNAALRVVGSCVKSGLISIIKQLYPDALLLPVITDNKLPEALAAAIGLEVCTKVRLKQKTFERKNLTGIERILTEPDFSGKIINNRKYIIVDDVVAQGGTVCALRRFVLQNGGAVCAVTALARSANAGRLDPERESLRLLAQRAGFGKMREILKACRQINDINELTNPQIKYLLKFKQTKSFEKKASSAALNKSFFSTAAAEYFKNA